MNRIESLTRPFFVPVLCILAAAPMACAVVDHPVTTHAALTPSSSTWADVLRKPGILDHEAVVSARWAVPLSGLLNLDHPAAQAAGLVDADIKILLPVHVITHPKHGVFVIDTGVPSEVVTDNFLVDDFLSTVETVETIEAIVARQSAPFGGAFLTHFHLDHVLGIPGLPENARVYVGPGDTVPTSLTNAITRGTFQAAVAGRAPLLEWDFTHGQKMGPINSAIDIFGDGSLWALHSPGHTPGSTAYLAMTTTGPKLFAGDTSHTIWGWEHGVEPGEYTSDHAENAQSLAALRALAATYPEIEVFVGHELDGEGTGVIVPNRGNRHSSASVSR